MRGYVKTKNFSKRVIGMIFKLVEKFTSELNKMEHYEKHFTNERRPEKILKKVDERTGKKRALTPDEYEKMAEELSYMPVDNKRIYGYVSKDRKGRTGYVKWDRETCMFTVYKWVGNHTETITAFHKDFREYNSEMWDDVYGYAGEIPPGK